MILIQRMHQFEEDPWRELLRLPRTVDAAFLGDGAKPHTAGLHAGREADIALCQRRRPAAAGNGSSWIKGSDAYSWMAVLPWPERGPAADALRHLCLSHPGAQCCSLHYSNGQ